MSAKVIVIGIDGASFNVLDNFIKNGLMPNLEEAMRSGDHCNFIIDTNERGWATMFTGKDASEHGGFYWKPDFDSYVLHDSFSIQEYNHLAIWTRLSEAGAKVGLIGVPTTYPPPEVNGFVVANGGGGLHPTLAHAVYPRDLLKTSNKFSEYILDVRYDAYASATPKTFFEDLKLTVDRRKEIALELFKRFQLDLAILAFEGPDRMLHWFYDHVIETSKSNEDSSALADLIREYYRALDQVIGEMIHFLGNESAIFIVSDHGFCRHDYDVHLNAILCDLGFAAPQANAAKRLKEQLMNIAIDHLAPGVRISIKKAFKRISKKSHYTLTAPALNWDKTLAFGHSGCGVYINKKDLFRMGVVLEHDYQSVVDDVIGALREFIDPHTGKRLFHNVRHRSEKYHGPHAQYAPDIIFSLPKGYDVNRRLVPIGKEKVQQRSYRFDGTSEAMPKRRTGIHSSEGIFITCGRGAKGAGRIKDFGMENLVPMLEDAING